MLVLPFPNIDPVALAIGPVEIKWYGLAYMVGLLLGWLYIRRLLSQNHLWPNAQAPFEPSKADDLLLYMTVGVIIGGRLTRRNGISRCFAGLRSGNLGVRRAQRLQSVLRDGCLRRRGSNWTVLWAHGQLHQRRALGQTHNNAVGHDLSGSEPLSWRFRAASP